MTDPIANVDVAQIAADDALLTALVRGEAPPADDDLAGMLSAWRADLSSSPSSSSPPSSPPAPVVPVDRARRRRRRALIVVVTAVVGIGAGTSAAAASAGPDSPLWPITQILYADRASSRVAEQEAETSIEKAREAIAQQRYADAEQLLNEAKSHTADVTEPDAVERLLGEIAAVQGLLPGLLGDSGRAGGNPSSGGTNPTTAPSPGSTGGTNPTPTATSGGILPPLPIPPLPSLLPSPLPTLPLPLVLGD